MTSANTNNATWTLSVDFGTTSTVAALTFADGRTEVLEVDGERRTPSVVLVDDDGSLVVGAAAVGLATSRPERTIRAPKRRLGEQTPVVLGGKPFNPVDLVASVLRHVSAEAVRHVGTTPTSIRLTHPATWSRPLQQRLLEAAAKAGMANAELVAEPVAAAMAAADRALPVGSYIAVYDLGGGTFDTTVVQSTEHGYTVVGHPIGDRQIGGELFDEALMNHVGSRLEPALWEKLQVSDEREWHQASTRLLGECRRVKEALSTHGYGEIVVGTPGGMVEERITRDELESIVAPYLDASVDLLERCVDEVGIDPSQLAAIHMIGGASRMPLAATMVEEAFPGVEVSRRGDPRTAVAVGAALVDLSAVHADVVADHNTTVERRQRSIDAQAAAIDAAAAAKAATAAEPAASVASEPAVASPEHFTVQGAVPHEPPPHVSPPGTPTQSIPTAPVQHTQPVGAATPPPGNGLTGPSGSDKPAMPVLLGIGALGLLLIAGLTFMLTRDSGDETDNLASPSKATQATTTSVVTGSLATLPTEDTTTTTAAPQPTSSTTVAPAGGPSRDDAVDLLFDVDEIPGEGWQNDTFEYDPLLPCGIVDPHQPTFVEGRSFIRNAGTIDVVILSQQVIVYANDAEAAAVMATAEALGTDCPTDTIDVNGTDFLAIFQSCDIFETCGDTISASTVDFLAGDQYILQLAFLTDQATSDEIVDQIYGMRIGRSIVVLEYITPGEPTEEQYNEASTAALTAWGLTADYPR